MCHFTFIIYYPSTLCGSITLSHNRYLHNYNPIFSYFNIFSLFLLDLYNSSSSCYCNQIDILWVETPYFEIFYSLLCQFHIPLFTSIWMYAVKCLHCKTEVCTRFQNLLFIFLGRNKLCFLQIKTIKSTYTYYSVTLGFTSPFYWRKIKLYIITTVSCSLTLK